MMVIFDRQFLAKFCQKLEFNENFIKLLKTIWYEISKMGTGGDWNFHQRFSDHDFSADCLIVQPSYRMWVIPSTSFYIQMHRYLKFLESRD